MELHSQLRPLEQKGYFTRERAAMKLRINPDKSAYRTRSAQILTHSFDYSQLTGNPEVM